MVTPRSSAVIVTAAALIGLIADQLFRAPVWGINVTIAAGMLAAAGLAMPSQEGRAPWPWLASVFFAAMWAVRDAPLLLLVDLLAALSLASLPLLQERGVRLRAMHLVDLLTAPLRTAWVITFGTLDFAHLVRAWLRPGRVSGGHAKAIGAGVLLATPLVLLFGTLFASADPVFHSAVSFVFQGDISPVLSHAITVGALAWASAGYLWTLAKPPRPYTPLVQVPQIGSIQVLTPLIATVALFGLFVAVQATSLYVRMYGLTEDRINGTAVMVWIAGTLGVFAVTVARGRPGAAAYGSLIWAVVALAMLNLVNPKELIARYNLTHQTGREIDFEHLARLGGDAVPVLVAEFELVPAEVRCRLVTDLRSRYVAPQGDWRGWNLARAGAHEAALRLAPMGPSPTPPPPSPPLSP